MMRQRINADTSRGSSWYAIPGSNYSFSRITVPDKHPKPRKVRKSFNSRRGENAVTASRLRESGNRGATFSASSTRIWTNRFHFPTERSHHGRRALLGRIAFKSDIAGSHPRSAFAREGSATSRAGSPKHRFDSRRGAVRMSSSGWGVVQLVGHLTVNEDGVGSSPTAPAIPSCRR
jgi:hypothetical protein